ncbi:MAG: hypothetical protein K1X72_02700 [Pyrinomonadaceae bacterium]|nr:hypothetical protein [Pyrinomonadaceae bacterium]
MIKIAKLLLIILVIAVSVFAQNGKSKIKSENLDPENLPKELKAFIPSGYEALNATKGDLNLDSFPDVILVVRQPNEHETSDVVDHPTKRPLLILIGEGNNKYRLAAKNDNAVYCVDCGGVFGDPFEGISIKNGIFSVEHYGGSAWRWTKIITFKYSPTDKNWLLTRVGSDSFHVSDPNKVKSTLKTAKSFGKVLFEKYDVYKD